MLLQENKRVRTKIPPAFETLIAPHMSRVDDAIEPGLTMLTWTSLNMDRYIENVYARLAELELLMDRANDLTEFRIDAVLHEMSTTMLCELPDNDSWTVDFFLERCQVGDTLFTSLF